MGRFLTVILSPGYVEYHTPCGGALKNNVKPQKCHTNWRIPSTHNAHLYEMDPSMGATASLHQSGPNESAACSCASSDDHVVCFRDQPACICGTGTTGTTPAIPPNVPKARTTGSAAGSNFAASATRARKRFVFTRRRRVDAPASEPPAGPPEAQKCDNCNTYPKTTSTTSQRRLFNGHLERCFSFPEGAKPKRCLNRLFVSGEKDIFPTTGTRVGRKTLRGARPRVAGFKRGSCHHRHCAEWKTKKLILRAKTSHALAHRFLSQPLVVAGGTPSVVEPLAVTPRTYHATCKLAEV